jgi:hypothetical protein
VARGDLEEDRYDEPYDRRGRRVGCLGVLVAATAVPIVLLAIAAVTGLGLERNLASFPALAASVAIVLLPIAGLASLIGAARAVGGLGACGWFWSLVLLLALPLYFPGERDRAASSGLVLLSSPLGDESRDLVIETGDGMIALLGEEPRPTPLAEELPDAGVEAQRAARDAGRARALLEAEGQVVVPYEGGGEALKVAAFFDGPRYGEEFAMVFDTGATYTTLDRASLALLEIEVPDDAPLAVLRTANGEIEAPLVLVDAVWLGDAVVEWVTVAVCEPCSTDDFKGLLGLNVSGQFQVSLDHDHKLIQLAGLGGDENRKLDIAQWLGLRSRMLSWRDGRLEIEVTAKNRSGVPIHDVAAEIECPGGRFEVGVETVPGSDSVSRKMALPRGTDCSEYTVTLARAVWERDRF